MAAKTRALRVGVLHGPNLNLLGQRELSVYGAATLEEINASLAALGEDLGAAIECFQANGEGALVDWIHRTSVAVSGFVVNAGAYTHTSVALRDALVGVGRPFVEVHLSNVFAREEFRHRSLLADRAVGVISGFGPASYLLALRALVEHLQAESPPVSFMQ